MKSLTALAIFGNACAAADASAPSDSIVINHLSSNNSLIRVDGQRRFLMLPVQESVDDARINLIADGNLAETFYVRLAESQTDYAVPFDLSPYSGRHLVFDVVVPENKTTASHVKEAVWPRVITLADSFPSTNTETQFRPAFHHTPLYGWMNDPNGMFFNDGLWHLYYQYNPYGSKWQNMTWGHSSSPDLLTWTHHPAALRPDALGAIFSGSCVVDKDGSAGFGPGAVVALYTSAGTNQMQSFAFSLDNGESFTKLPSNPVLTLDSEARDPNMFWNEATGQWNLVLAHPLDHEMLFFTSPDLRQWSLSGNFGKGLGAQGGVWECPDLFELPVPGTDTSKWVLICNINPGGPFGGSGIQYFIGDWDGKTFTADLDSDGRIPTKWLDHGKDNYALVSWSNAPDNRRVAIGWMSNWQYAADVPTRQFRSANTLPVELSLFRSAADGELYLASNPAGEVGALRSSTSVSRSGISLSSRPRSFALPSDNSGICELVIDIDSSSADSVRLILSNPLGQRVVMTYCKKNHTFAFDRTASGIVDFSPDFPAVTVAPTHEGHGRLSLRIFIDRASIEIFGNGGQFAMTNLVFPSAPYNTLSIDSAGGKASLSSIKIYPLHPTTH